ncbi:MAG: diguanylate cyclase [Thermosipho sp. (in: Bacteria)]|nr:diguanylate cyclase [Thermosipho sp. (in: thermotogales)]
MIFIKLKNFILNFLISTVAFIIIVLIFRWTLVPKGVGIYKFKVLDNKEQFGENLNVPFYFVLKEPTHLTLYAKIPELTENVYLYFPQVDTSYIKIYANDNLVGSYGFTKETAHIWYQPLIFQLPETTNEIKITLHGVYELGMDFVPYLIDESQLKKYNILSFLTGDVLSFSIGMVLALSFILLFLSKNVVGRKKTAFIYFFLTSLLGSIWMIDLLPLKSMGSIYSMFILRKIFISSIYFAFSFLITGTYLYLNLKEILLIRILRYTNYVIGFSLLLAPSFYVMKLMTNSFAPVIFLNSLFFFFISIKSKINISLFTSSFFFLTVSHDSLTLFLHYNNKFLSNYGIITLFFGFSYNIIYEYKKMVNEVQEAYEQSVVDKLTGAYNRGVLESISLTESDILIFVDINSLKFINDTFGHKVGDKILKDFVKFVKNNIRSSDYIIRIGGDEFLIVLKNCPFNRAEEIISRVFRELKSSNSIKPTFSWGIAKFNESFDKTFEEADKRMYAMKEEFDRENQRRVD